MKNKNIKISFLALLLFTGGFYSCAEAPKEDEAVVEETVIEETESMDDEYSFMLPSPIQIAAIFSNAGLEFEGNLVNPVENKSKYNTKTFKFLNFGVYSADLAYSVLNNQQQMSIDYINSVRVLAEEIGMPTIFGTGELIKSFEKNIGNQDTILKILTTIKKRTDEYLADNSESSKEAVFFAGAWVEGMYIGANAHTSSTNLTSKITEQMTIVNNIVKGLEFQKDGSLDLEWLIQDLKTLENTFNNFDNVKAYDADETGKVLLKLDETELGEIKNQITAIRTKLVNG